MPNLSVRGIAVWITNMIPSTKSDPSAPLAATLARIAALDPHTFAAGLGDPDPGWFPATALWDADSARLLEGLAHSTRSYPGAERRTAGAFFIGHYAWYLAGAAICAYLAERRIPDLSPANVALRYGSYTWYSGDQSGQAENIEVRFVRGHFAVLANDPAAAHPDALVLPSAPALREWLREALEQHIAPLIDGVYAVTRLGKRAQWNLVADSCARLFQHAGQHLGDEPRACAEGLAFIQSPVSPMRASHTRYLTLECNGHRDTFVERGGCCLYYRVAPGQNCSTCPLRPAEERTQLLLDYMTETYSRS
jgi:hypothetical protein